MALSTTCQSAGCARLEARFRIVPRHFEILDAGLAAREVPFVHQRRRIDDDGAKGREIAQLRSRRRFGDRCDRRQAGGAAPPARSARLRRGTTTFFRSCS